MSEKDLTGKGLERRVADAYRQMGATKVVHDVEVAGNQLDVYVELPATGHSVHRVAVEVKDYAKPVGIRIINDFAHIVRLLHGERLIDEGVIVSSGGFSKQARNAAASYELQLFEPADLEAMAARTGVGALVQPVPTPVPPPDTPVREEAPPATGTTAFPDSPPLNVVREMLLAAFTASDLRRLFVYAPADSPLRPLVNRISKGDSLSSMADAVIEYCEVQALFGELLRVVQQANPRQYARFEGRLSG